MNVSVPSFIDIYIILNFPITGNTVMNNIVLSHVVNYV